MSDGSHGNENSSDIVGADLATAKKGEAYLDIVWKQFKKHTMAYISLWMLLPWFLIAIFAPAIASNWPFVFFDDEKIISPWLRSLFHPSEAVDFIFNMALLGFFPWLALALVTNSICKKRKVHGRRRIFFAGLLYLFVTTVLTIVFSGTTDQFLSRSNLPRIRPSHKYRTRTFSKEEFQSPETKKGIYSPIQFGSEEQDLDSLNKPPLYRKDKSLWKESNDGALHLLGTDDTGRDVLVVMIYGTRIAMTVGFIAVGLYISIGIIVGAIAGYFGGRTDMLLSRIIEIVLLFPSFFLILTLIALIGPSIYIIMFVIGITGWPTMARLIRGEVLKQRAIDYTSAARALGASHFRIIFRHILPNALGPAIVSAPFGISSAIITEAGLSLLGYGVRPPMPSWGALLNMAQTNYSYWWLIVVPSIAIFTTVTVFNLIGSGLRDAMDPKLRA